MKSEKELKALEGDEIQHMDSRFPQSNHPENAIWIDVEARIQIPIENRGDIEKFH